MASGEIFDDDAGQDRLANTSFSKYAQAITTRVGSEKILEDIVEFGGFLASIGKKPWFYRGWSQPGCTNRGAHGGHNATWPRDANISVDATSLTRRGLAVRNCFAAVQLASGGADVSIGSRRGERLANQAPG